VYIDVYHNGYGLRVPPLPALFSGFTPIPPLVTRNCAETLDISLSCRGDSLGRCVG